MAHVRQTVRVIVAAAVAAVSERVKHRVAGLGRRLDEIEDVAHWHAAPLGNARPALDAEMRRDLLLLGHHLQLGERQLDGVFDQAVDPQPVARKFGRDKRIEFRRFRHRAVGPKVRRNVFLTELALRIPRLRRGAERPAHEFADSLHQPRMAQGKRRGPPPGEGDHQNGRDENRKAAP